jgi:hypothetical protein
MTQDLISRLISLLQTLQHFIRKSGQMSLFSRDLLPSLKRTPLHLCSFLQRSLAMRVKPRERQPPTKRTRNTKLEGNGLGEFFQLSLPGSMESDPNYVPTSVLERVLHLTSIKVPKRHLRKFAWRGVIIKTLESLPKETAKTIMAKFDSFGKDKQSAGSLPNQSSSSSLISANADLLRALEKQLALCQATLTKETECHQLEISSLQSRLDEQTLASQQEISKLHDLLETSQTEKLAIDQELRSLQAQHQNLVDKWCADEADMSSRLDSHHEQETRHDHLVDVHSAFPWPFQSITKFFGK